jgi:hypothetical protein
LPDGKAVIPNDDTVDEPYVSLRRVGPLILQCVLDEPEIQVWLAAIEPID